jgi:hypothetical protein
MRHQLRPLTLLALSATLGLTAPAQASFSVCSMTPSSVSATWIPASTVGGFVFPAHVGVSWTLAQEAGGCYPLLTAGAFFVTYAPEGQPMVNPPRIVDPTARAENFFGLPAHQRYSFCVKTAIYGGGFSDWRCSALVSIP